MPEGKSEPPEADTHWSPASGPHSGPNLASRNLIEWAGGRRVTLAVVFTDIVGSTVLRRKLRDAGMSEVLHAHFANSDALIAQHGGFRVKTIGDGVMAVFRSAGAALDFAQGLQAEPGSPEIRLRAGIHVGEMDVELTDVAGIEVVVAARVVDGIAGARICVTDRAKIDIDGLGASHHQDLRWQRLAKASFKGLEDRPISLWVLPDAAGLEGDAASCGLSDATGRQAGAAKTQRKARPAAARNAFDERPAIAVLPFRNLSNLPDQGHFSDGIADDVINELASCRLFPVIARSSSFTFKDQLVGVAEVGRRLGARYVVEGSFNRIAQRVRISGRLVDASTGIQMASERFDRDIDELPQVQDQITEMIVGSIAPEVLRVERERVAHKPRNKPTSYEYFLRGQEAHYRYTKTDNAVAQLYFRKAIEIDPRNAQAQALLAHAMIHAVQLGWLRDDAHNYEVANQLALRALALDPRAPFGHFALGSAAMFLGRIDQALREMRETVRINPSHAAGHAIMAHLLCYVDEPAEARESVTWALRLSPYDPRLGLWLAARAQANYFLKNYDEAAAVGQQALFLIAENPVAQRFTAASFGQLGRVADGAPLIAVLRNSPAPSIEAIRKSVSHLYRDPQTIEHMLDGLRKAGLE